MAINEIHHFSDTTTAINDNKWSNMLFFNTTLDQWGGYKTDGTTLRMIFTTDSVRVPTTNLARLQLDDGAFVGLGAAKGRIEFNDIATDSVNILDARVGIGTTTPFFSVAGSSNFSGGGLHIKDSATARLFIEGVPAAFYVVDSAGAADDKIFELVVNAGVAKYASLLDNMSSRVNNILVLDMGTGNVGMGIAATDSLLHVHKATAGTVTAFAGTVITAESSGDTFVSVLSPFGNTSGIVFGSPGAGLEDAGGIRYGHTAAQMIFRTNDIDNMVLAGDGKLRVGSAGSAETVGHFRGTSGVDATITIEATSGDDATFKMKNSSVKANQDIGFIKWDSLDSNDNDTIFADIKGEAVNHIDGLESASITFRTMNASGSLTERFKILPTGISFLGAGGSDRIDYTLNATVVTDRTLLASASATVTNNNNVLAAIITDLIAFGLFK